MKKSNVKKGILVIALIAAGAINVNAQESKKEEHKKHPTFEQLLDKLDTNKDGKLSKAEAKGPLSHLFDKIDADKNSFISKTELENAPKRKHKGKGEKRHHGDRPTFEQLLDKLDTNKDSKLSKAEAKGPLSHHFDKIDTDKNGFISKTELENTPKSEGHKRHCKE